jgi:hypothetical protein
MAIIDTLRLARALSDKGGFSINAAEATAAALNEALGEDVATKADIDRLETSTRADINRLETSTKADINRLDSKLDASVARLDSKLTVLMWAIGINAAATITMLVRHWN